ncbi:MAG: 4-hydroxy-3-methylbut-2-enyl diphosphate reductase [Calditrichaeota bacterium]|nr:4-hydroxy-3-methylbut-2-enyl diphosphate reductase [Calditrichota bacterium]
MKVVIDPRAGFCGGVKRVVRIAERELSATPRPLLSLGDVIHNEREIARLETLGLRSADYSILERTADDAPRLLIRAHGETPDIFESAQCRGYELIDGTCPVVTRSQNLARAHHLAGEQIVIIGKPHHPETKGIVGHCDGNAIVVFERSDILQLHPKRRTFVLAQTTIPADWFAERVTWVRERCREVVVENTICRFVLGRDRDLRRFAAEVDVLIFVGGTRSSNTKSLFEVCRQVNPRSCLIVDENEMDVAWFRPEEVVGISGSASTPRWQLEQVAHFLEQLTLTEKHALSSTSGCA